MAELVTGTTKAIDWESMIALDDNESPSKLITIIGPDLDSRITEVEAQFDKVYKNASKTRKCRKLLDSKVKAFDEEQLRAQKAIFKNVTQVFNDHSELSAHAKKVTDYVGACIRHFQVRGAQYETSAHPRIDKKTREYLNNQSMAAGEFVTLLSAKYGPTCVANLNNINTEMKNTNSELVKISQHFPEPQEPGSGWSFSGWWSGKPSPTSDEIMTAAAATQDGNTHVDESRPVQGPPPKPADHVAGHDAEVSLLVAQPTVKTKERDGAAPAQNQQLVTPDATQKNKFVDAETHAEDLGPQISKKTSNNQQTATTAGNERRRISKKKKK